MDTKQEQIRDEIIKMQGIYSTTLENFLVKVKTLIEKNKEAANENHQLKETLKELNTRITELKIQLNKLNSDSLQKDKEISDLKNLLIIAEDGNTIVRDKDFVKSRLKELISRIDVHLEQYDEKIEDYED